MAGKEDTIETLSKQSGNYHNFTLPIILAFLKNVWRAYLPIIFE